MNLEKLKEVPKQKVLVLVTVVALACFILLNMIMSPIELHLKGTTGYGVLEFEFAWTADTIRTIFKAWGKNGKQMEALAVWLDFLYIPSYVFLIAGTLLLTTRSLNEGKVQNIGLILIISPFIAGILDVIENINLLAMIYNGAFIDLGSPFIASICATFKFGIIFLDIIFWIFELIILLLQKINN
ncbi:MAG: hypothetical protein ACTSR8_20680 [Promethearchaeota archaeon]